MRDETTKASALSVTCSRSYLTMIFMYLPHRADERLQLALLSNQTQWWMQLNRKSNLPSFTVSIESA